MLWIKPCNISERETLYMQDLGYLNIKSLYEVRELQFLIKPVSYLIIQFNPTNCYILLAGASNLYVHLCSKWSLTKKMSI
jgi:hypothetical protein